MDEARAVLQRLERIEALRDRAPASAVLAELRELVREAEAWVKAEGEPPEAVAAVERVTDALAADIIPA